MDDDISIEIADILMEQYENASVSEDDDPGPAPDRTWFGSMAELVLLDFFSIQQRTSDFDNHVDFASKILKCTTTST